MAGPLVILYGVSILIVKLVNPAEDEDEENEDEENEDEEIQNTEIKQ